jgi:hypothetical protein
MNRLPQRRRGGSREMTAFIEGACQHSVHSDQMRGNRAWLRLRVCAAIARVLQVFLEKAAQCLVVPSTKTSIDSKRLCQCVGWVSVTRAPCAIRAARNPPADRGALASIPCTRTKCAQTAYG